MTDDDDVTAVLRHNHMAMRLAAQEVLRERHDKSSRAFELALNRLAAAASLTRPMEPPFVKIEAVEAMLMWLADEYGALKKALGRE